LHNSPAEDQLYLQPLQLLQQLLPLPLLRVVTQLAEETLLGQGLLLWGMLLTMLQVV
jgi:hypothetical protein